MTEVKFNLQQQPKTPGYLECYKARAGYKLVQADLTAIEPHIIAEFSKDPTMLKLYGPGAAPNDIYLFAGAHIALFRDEIRKYYDPDKPTAESIALAKKHCKQLRNICKAITLACGYSAGVKKVRSMLITLGYPMTIDEARIIHRDYWQLYAGIKKFQQKLEMIWSEQGGYIPSVLGTPICIAAQYISDAVNRFAQTSGHMCLQKFLYHTDKLRTERGIRMAPWIADWHDEFIFECLEADVPAALQAIVDALEITNQELGMTIQIKAEPMVADNLAEIKLGDEYSEWLATKQIQEIK